ncbi:MAG: glycosyltransferase family 4 protein [Trebonia sp.]
MTRAKPAVAVAVHDGFYGCGTGAGASNHAFLRALCDLLSRDVQLTVIPVELAPDSPEYDADWHASSLELVTRAGAKVVPVGNGTAGATRFGGLGNFRHASASAAQAITAALGQAPRSLAVAFDAPFFGLAPLLPDRHAENTVIVARATAALHAPGDHERIAWERDGLSALAASGGHVAATSRHIREHLTRAYAIPDESITDLTNGLAPGEIPARPARGRELPPPAAGRGFLLAYGRAEPYKGFDDLLDALPIAGQTGIQVPHLVLGAVTDEARGYGTSRPEATSYQRHLADRIEREDLDVTLRTRFDPRFRELLAHPALAAVIVPSREEPFGRIPLEAYQAGASPVVATTAGGLAEIVTEGHTGFTADPGDPPSLAAAVLRALTASPAQRRRLLAQGRSISAARFDYPANIRSFLEARAPWALRADQSA